MVLEIGSSSSTGTSKLPAARVSYQDEKATDALVVYVQWAQRIFLNILFVLPLHEKQMAHVIAYLQFSVH